MGDTIAFMTIDGRVATIQRDGSGRADRVTGDTANSGGDAQEAVAWSPDGAQIAYVANDDIYVRDADGSNMLRGSPTIRLASSSPRGRPTGS